MRNSSIFFPEHHIGDKRFDLNSNGKLDAAESAIRDSEFIEIAKDELGLNRPKNDFTDDGLGDVGNDFISGISNGPRDFTNDGLGGSNNITIQGTYGGSHNSTNQGSSGGSGGYTTTTKSNDTDDDTLYALDIEDTYDNDDDNVWDYEEDESQKDEIGNAGDNFTPHIEGSTWDSLWNDEALENGTKPNAQDTIAPQVNNTEEGATPETNEKEEAETGPIILQNEDTQPGDKGTISKQAIPQTENDFTAHPSGVIKQNSALIKTEEKIIHLRKELKVARKKNKGVYKTDWIMAFSCGIIVLLLIAGYILLFITDGSGFAALLCMIAFLFFTFGFVGYVIELRESYREVRNTKTALRDAEYKRKALIQKQAAQPTPFAIKYSAMTDYQLQEALYIRQEELDTANHKRRNNVFFVILSSFIILILIAVFVILVHIDSTALTALTLTDLALIGIDFIVLVWTLGCSSDKKDAVTAAKEHYAKAEAEQQRRFNKP